jgi:hypothetical protein
MKKIIRKIFDIFNKESEAERMYKECRKLSGVMRAQCDTEIENH